MRKAKRVLSMMLCVATILGSVIGITALAYAETSHLDVRASGVSGVSSKDPYSVMTTKSDNEQNFYIKLTQLENGPQMSFTSYNSQHVKVSNPLTITSAQVGTTRSHSYDIQAGLAGAKYYVLATAPSYYVDVHAIGNYCP